MAGVKENIKRKQSFMIRDILYDVSPEDAEGRRDDWGQIPPDHARLQREDVVVVGRQGKSIPGPCVARLVRAVFSPPPGPGEFPVLQGGGPLAPLPPATDLWYPGDALLLTAGAGWMYGPPVLPYTGLAGRPHDAQGPGLGGLRAAGGSARRPGLGSCLTGGCCDGCPPHGAGRPLPSDHYGRTPGGLGPSRPDTVPVPIPIPVYVRSRASPNSAGNTRPKKCRRSRTVFSELQLMGLERRFSDQKYLSTSDRSDLALALGLSQVQVKTWYQNRRMKWKKQVLQEGATEPPTKSKGRPRKQAPPGGDNGGSRGSINGESNGGRVSGDGS